MEYNFQAMIAGRLYTIWYGENGELLATTCVDSWDKVFGNQWLENKIREELAKHLNS